MIKHINTNYVLLKKYIICKIVFTHYVYNAKIYSKIIKNQTKCRNRKIKQMFLYLINVTPIPIKNYRISLKWSDIMSTETIIKGISVVPGFVKGKARVVINVEELESVEPGEIVVIPESNPMYALAVMKASGLICENGGRLSHICVVAMEMGIPCITGVREATKQIVSGQYITLNSEQAEICIDG